MSFCFNSHREGLGVTSGIRPGLSSDVLARIYGLLGRLAAALLLLLLSPFLILLALLVLLDDGGPVFHNQIRVGKNGRLFTCFKFRSMVTDAEERLALWRREASPLFSEYRHQNFKLRDDPRITRIGRFLRAHSLDELPQLANVMLGQMALVGPRPLLPEETADYGAALRYYLTMTPGITGLWQVRGRSNTGFRRRAQYDVWYAKHRTAALDALILLKTLPVVLKRDGAY